MLKKIFKKAVDACIEVFGKNAFRNCINFNSNINSKKIMYKSMSKPVYDLQMLGFAEFELDLIRRYKEQVKNRYEEIVLNMPDMAPYYKRMSRKSVIHRISRWKKEIEEIIKYS